MVESCCRSFYSETCTTEIVSESVLEFFLQIYSLYKTALEKNILIIRTHKDNFKNNFSGAVLY